MFYDDTLGCAFEISSMGIRVSPESLDSQLKEAKADERRALPFHKMLLEGKLPTLKELTAEYVALKGQLDAYKPDLAELKSKLTDLKHIRYNYKILIRDTPQTDQYPRKGDRIER